MIVYSRQIKLMILIPGKSIKVNWCLNIITKKEKEDKKLKIIF